MTFDGDFDVKIALDGTTHKFRLLRTREGKAWSVREAPPSPRLANAASAKEGLPPERLLPFEAEDWSWGTGLLRYTPQFQRPGHVLRYSDGFGIDTSQVGQVRHGPLTSNVGSALAATPIQSLLFDNKVWFLTNEHLYNWTGSSLTLFWTNADGALNLSMEVHGANLFVATSFFSGSPGANRYYFTNGTGAPAARNRDSNDHSSETGANITTLSLAGNLWRAYATNQIASSNDPEAASPAWGNVLEVGDGDAITNLYSISGLLGVATQSTLYVIDADNNVIELNKALRTRRSANAFTIKAESGSDVWFSDGVSTYRVVSESFEVFDIRLGGPFHSTDEVPITSPEAGEGTIDAIAQDIDAVYIVASRGGDVYVYKGVEIARGILVWSPLVKETSTTSNFCVVAKMTGDSQAIVYFNSGTQVKKFDTVWTTYAASWELHTSFFTATLESWDKMWHKLRAFLDLDTNAKIIASYRVNRQTSFTLFASPGEMTADGNNELKVTTPVAGKRIQLKFAGSTTNSSDAVHLLSFLLEGILRADHARLFQFTVVADSKTEADFLYSLRTDNDSFITITDRFGTARTAFVLPGFPVEIETMDEPLHEPVRAYQLMCQEVT